MKPRDQFESLDDTPDTFRPRKGYDGTTYCQAQTNIFIVVYFHAANAGVSSFLNACLNAIQRDIDHGNTGPIPSNGWYGPLGPNALSMAVWSQDNHQTTYEVLHSAIQELIAWMSSHHTYGTAGFTIWNGEHQVGHGTING